jgi:urease accessory protein UreF
MFSKAKMGMLLGAMAAVLSIGSLGSAMAADTTQTQTQTQAKDLNKPAEVNFKGSMGHRGGIGFGFGYEKNEELLALLKLDATKLSEELKAGKTLAAIAEAQGVEEDDVIALLVKQQEEKLAEAVKAGKLTQEQADKMTENAADRVKEQLENTHQGKGPGGFGFGGGFGYEKNEELLALLKLDAAKLTEELKAGKTLAAVAEAQGVEEDDVIALLVKQQEEKLAEAVKAGKLTQEQADKMTENSAERVKAMVENTHQDRGHGKMMFGFGFGKNEELLTLLKLDETKFKEELTAGKSLAEIAEAQGVDKQDVIDLLVSKQKEQLAEAVKAGKLTQEEADKRSEEFATIAQKVVEGTFEKVAFPRKEKEQDNAEKTTVTE